MAALQHRARETEDSLLDAAETLLRKGGLDACTVPEIAALAERSVGAVYRRFPDKDVLLRTLFRRYFARAAESNAKAIAAIEVEGCALGPLVHAMVGGMIAGQRRDRRLITALLSFARGHADAAFRREAAAMSRAGLMRFRDLLLARKSEIHRRDPERAVDMALAVLSLTTQGLLQRDEMNPLVEVSDQTLADELSAMVMGFLTSR